MMSDGQPPFKTLLGHGNVRDQFGHEMHKSAGNSIEFTAAADKGGEIKDPKGKGIPFNAIGADVMRWLYVRHNPAANLNFGPGDAADPGRGAAGLRPVAAVESAGTHHGRAQGVREVQRDGLRAGV
jgi:isoleucyl-tRNA synthetase